MIGCNDPGYLRDQQYRDASNLNARIEVHRRFSTNAYPWALWVFDQFELPETARVLEVGCGPGSLWQGNRDRIPAGWQITLSDFSAGMLAEARSNLDQRFSFQQADIQQLPFDDDSFDAVIANHMLYHVPDLDRGLREVRRVLKPDGKLYAATNGLKHLAEIELLLQQFDPTLTGGFAIRGVFALENAAALVGRHFEQVALRRYEDSLIVTEAEPLAAYICSGRIGEQIGSRRPALVAFLEAQIATHGAIPITKSSGLFVAHKYTHM